MTEALPTTFPRDLVWLDIPHFRCAKPQLFFDVLGGVDNRHAGRIARTAAGGQIGVARGVGIGDHRTHAFDGDAELFGHHHRLGDSGTADVGIARDHGGTAVRVECDGGARVHASIEPEAARHPTSLMGAERRRPMRMLADGVENSLQA